MAYETPPGCRGGWDIEQLRSRLWAWYVRHHRPLPWRQTGDPYRIWVSEVMLQQSQVKTVIPYYHKFLSRLPGLPQLAAADQQTILKLWEGLGYYARGRNLHRAASIVCDRHGGQVPQNREAFRKLPGVGDYIADAVLSIAFDQPHAVVDGNVKRVLSRLLQIEAPVNQPRSYPQFKAAATRLLDQTQPGTFNQAMMELGALICTPRRPQCGQCPLNNCCAAYEGGKVDSFPRRVKPKPVPEHLLVAGIVRKKDRLLIVRRPADGLLGGLWEFPATRLEGEETTVEACRRGIQAQTGVTIQVAKHLMCVRHAYTHFKIRMDVYWCEFVGGRVRLAGPADFRWVRPPEIDDLPFHKANLKFIPQLKKVLARGANHLTGTGC